jgi:feruloyl esterase
MVNWVENGVAPDVIHASGGGRTRPLCPFPQKAIYNGTGDPNLESSFYCGGNVQTKEAICAGLVTKYGKETQNSLWTYGLYNPAACNPNSKVPIGK